MSEFDPMPHFLSTPRLRLRPWAETDAAQYRALWLERDPRSTRTVSPDGSPTVDELRDAIRTQLAAYDAAGFGLLVVERRADNNVIGYCGLIVRDPTPEEPELAYELLRASHGRGYATEAARAVRDAAAATGRTRLWAGVRVWNTASLRVLDKIGFTSTGQRTPDSERGDTLLMTCLLTQPQQSTKPQTA